MSLNAIVEPTTDHPPTKIRSTTIVTVVVFDCTCGNTLVIRHVGDIAGCKQCYRRHMIKSLTHGFNPETHAPFIDVEVGELSAIATPPPGNPFTTRRH